MGDACRPLLKESFLGTEICSQTGPTCLSGNKKHPTGEQEAYHKLYPWHNQYNKDKIAGGSPHTIPYQGFGQEKRGGMRIRFGGVRLGGRTVGSA